MSEAEEASALRTLGTPRPALTGANQELALGFGHDVLRVSRSIRVSSDVDAFTREYLALEVETD